MIVSHTHKFIFMKPTKVAGTSVEVNLARQCGDTDIVTVDQYDEATYKSIARPHPDFYNHMSPEDIRRKVGEDIWNTYTKITIIRNPYDLCVSRYWWEMSHKEAIDRIKSFSNLTLIYHYVKKHNFKKRFWSDFLSILRWKTHTPNPPHDFNTYLRLFPDIYTNTRFYLDTSNSKISDVYIRFEHINDDYRNLCTKLGIDFEPLPQLKTNLRSSKKDFKDYYTEETCKTIQSLFKRELSIFPYPSPK